MLDTDFKIVGSCVARPHGVRRVLLDAICRLTGHLLWRNQHTEYLPPNASLSVSTSHCRRCHRWGYVEADYRPRPAAPPRVSVRLPSFKTARPRTKSCALSARVSPGPPE
jgi:hypothetical protein